MARKYMPMMKMNRQSGVTLITSLIMLVVLTLLALASIRSSTGNLRIAGNAQVETEAVAAAQLITERYISTNFTAALAGSNVTVAQIYNVTVTTPSCLSTRAVLNADLNPSNANDLPCFSSSTASNTGINFVSSPATAKTQSWCYNQGWDVRTQATDTATGTGANAAIHQGTSLRVRAGTLCP